MGDAVTVLTRVEDGVAIISLNRPERHNAIDHATRAALSEAFELAEQNETVHAVLLRGEGRSFCSGRDRDGFLDPARYGSQAALVEDGQAIRRQQVAMTKPILCAMQGHVIGGGAELALGCDFRIAADDLRFRFAEVGFGVVGDTGSSQRLVELVGPARAKWLLLSGEAVGAAETVAWGLAEWVVPSADLTAAALTRAKRLAAQPPAALVAQKRLIDVQGEAAFAAALEREKSAILTLFDGAEFAALQETAEKH